MPSPEKFKKSLEQFGIDPEVSARIGQGYEDICDRSPKKTRAAYFKQVKYGMYARMALIAKVTGAL